MFNIGSPYFSWSVGIACSVAIVSSANYCVVAQITPDRTLLNNSRVTTQNNIRMIEGGTQAGHNLFHSFQEFSVPTGSSAYFNNAADVQNIISRVTGGLISNINGLIRANGTANLFLLNPNGIIFGSLARLNVGGSFVATTANAIKFGNLGFFSASNPEAPSPLLTVNPSALLFNQFSPAPIQNNSVAPAGLDRLEDIFTLGLRVPDGQSLLLVGGNVSMNNGGLYAFGGRVELGGLTEPGTVELKNDGNGLSLNFPNGVVRGDVSLTRGARVNVTGESGGSIAINAQNIDILGKSTLTGGIASNQGRENSQAGDITLNATETIKVEQGSQIENNVNLDATGNSGNINIIAGSLSLTDGALLRTTTFGQGNAGSVIIDAKDRVSLNRSDIESSVQETDRGKSGDIRITTDSLSLTNGASFVVRTNGSEDAGNAIINARERVLFDESDVFSIGNEFGTGKGGDIRITTGLLSATNGALLSTNLAEGTAGNIMINARGVSFDRSDIESSKDIQISNDQLSATNSTNLLTRGSVIIDAKEQVLFDRSSATSLGDIRITTGELLLKNAAALDTSTLGNSYGQGDASSITINARDRVSFDNSRVSSQALVRDSIGKGGDIRITTGELLLRNGAEIGTGTRAIGDAGNVIIDVRDLVSLDRSLVSSIVAPQGKGKGGDLTISTSSLSLTNGTELRTTSSGEGNAGNVFLNAKERLFFNEGSGVLSSVIDGGKGKGGDTG